MRVLTLGQLAEAIHRMESGYQAEVSLNPSRLTVQDSTTGKIVLNLASLPLRTMVTQAIGVFGDALDVDPDEVFPVGSEVKVGTLIGRVVGMSMRGRSRRVKTYRVELYRTNTVQEIESRDVFKT